MSDKSGRKPEGTEKPGPQQAAHPGGLPDAVELSREMAEIAEKSQRLVADFLQRQGGEQGIGMSNPMAIGAAFFEMTARMMSDPSRLVQAQLALWNDYLTLWQRTAQRFLGGGGAEPVIETSPEDRRFRDQSWNDSAL